MSCYPQLKQKGWPPGQSPGTWEGPSEMDSAFLESSLYLDDADATSNHSMWRGGCEGQLTKTKWGHNNFGDQTLGSAPHYWGGNQGYRPDSSRHVADTASGRTPEGRTDSGPSFGALQGGYYQEDKLMTSQGAPHEGAMDNSHTIRIGPGQVQKPQKTGIGQGNILVRHQGSNWQAFFTKFSRYAEVCELGPQECKDQL
ncbi:unnamed protein product [Mytilus coruscus]|uniref:Uncharacterized protein n=1 Tax=Mytilus coruscus TaxID=42192 RepID=A0A6J8CVV0_MYTCO|nr:unnamed protein product [Mytilus coruscus]